MTSIIDSFQMPEKQEEKVSGLKWLDMLTQEETESLWVLMYSNVSGMGTNHVLWPIYEQLCDILDLPYGIDGIDNDETLEKIKALEAKHPSCSNV